ncbi:hypothetical protein SOCE26_102190 [Sorangium cellulosum]|uniref:Uncharacterized protein n=1 Tax=Sorangium cellulosum TaxID=56 RepID=A0A2L0FAP7_SORCE|nr:hypothetical protein [Sorangium cellulosum]AUX48678.1 hypothetical protein SOCE26_102190 [Sorangium cellulosum]
MTSSPPASPASPPPPAPPGRWKPLAVLAAVFLFGGVAGTAIGRATAFRDLETTFRGPPTEARAQFRLRAMRRQLDLTDDQVRELRATLAEAEAEREKLLSECRPALDALRDRTDASVKGVLTPDQRARYEELEAERRRHPRPPPHGPGPRGRGPGGRGE